MKFTIDLSLKIRHLRSVDGWVIEPDMAP